ncbi:MAG TPA: hypothetical protein VGB45_03790 [Abditibacterium sp.]|jgi:hypothetical protein
MEPAELQSNWRKAIIEELHTLSSVEKQLEYQRIVPFVNVTVELVCGWFDDHYHPESKDFVAQFSTQELMALAKFNQLFDDILDSDAMRGESPQIEDLIKTREWKRLTQEAAQTLEFLNVTTAKTDQQR